MPSHEVNMGFSTPPSGRRPPASMRPVFSRMIEEARPSGHRPPVCNQHRAWMITGPCTDIWPGSGQYPGVTDETT